jgi:hypothetical protein
MRVHPLVIALFAIPGLIGRQGTLVEHEHAGGAESHEHAALAGYVAHSHPHPHPHPHDGTQGTEPATDEESSEEDRLPEDGDRHGHFQSAHAAAARRMIPGDDPGARLAAVALTPLTLATEQPARRAFDPQPSPGDPNGHPPSRTGRTIDRLVQGIGLLI